MLHILVIYATTYSTLLLGSVFRFQFLVEYPRHAVTNGVGYVEAPLHGELLEGLVLRRREAHMNAFHTHLGRIFGFGWVVS